MKNLFLFTLFISANYIAADDHSMEPAFPGLLSSEAFNLGNDMVKGFTG